MPFVDLNDITTHLPEDKFPGLAGQLSVSDSELFKATIDAERIVRGELAGVFLPTTIASWASPGQTPGLIRAIAGRLTTAKYYQLRLVEDYPDLSDYAQSLYDQAIAWLLRIASGDIILEEIQEIEPTRSALRFYPDERAPGPTVRIDTRFS